MHYHMTWLKLATEKYDSNTIDGSITIDEFIHLVLEDELSKVIKLDSEYTEIKRRNYIAYILKLYRITVYQ